MDSLEQQAGATGEMPRFDDGMVNIQELIRIMAESLVNEIMDAQAEDACADGNQRNGYRERSLVTSVGTINLRIPKPRRGTYFPDDLLVRYSRIDRAVIAAVSEMVTSGVSTRKVARVASALGVDRMSASQVSRICESLDATVEDMQTRGLSDTASPLRLARCDLHQMQGFGPRLLVRARHRHRRRLRRLPAPARTRCHRHGVLCRVADVSALVARAGR